MSRWFSCRCVVALLPLLSACVTFDKLSPRTAVTRRQIEVRFMSPRQVSGRSYSGEEITWRGVTRLIGRPVAARGDTLVLQVAGWASRSSWSWTSPPVIAEIVPHWSTEVGRQQFSAGRTVALIVATPVTLVLLAILLCLYDDTEACPVPST